MQGEKRGGRFTATVTGFAGHYKNSRTLYDDIRQMKEIGKEDVEKYIILHNPEVLKYINQRSARLYIYHTEKQ